MRFFQVFCSLTELINNLPNDDKVFPQTLLANLEKRFPSGCKTLAPYNALTLLDPR
jgi:hypothetical protein